MDRSEVIGNGKGLLNEKGLEEKVLEEVAMATGERDTITTGEGCYGDGRWLLWRWGWLLRGWEMVAMGMGDGCYGDGRWLLW